jgi:cation transport ATPase
MSRRGGTHDSSPSERGQGRRPRIDPKYSRVLLPAVMAAAMSLVMSLVDTIVRFAPNLASAWLGSFVVVVVVAVPTAILIAPAAQRPACQLPRGQQTDH